MSLELQSISRRFGRQQALEKLCLKVERGDIYGLLGHNGAGKTTAMRIALGLLRPHAGRVLVDGFDMARHPREGRARMGGLIESPGFHPAQSARSNLFCLARLQGLDSRSASLEAARLLELVGLNQVGRKPVRAFSQGMRQRLGIAEALLGRPAYILLDEPTNGLDPEGIADMRALFLRLRQKEGQTLLVSSHRLRELKDLCNRIGIIKQGKLLVEASTKELLGQQGRLYGIESASPGLPEALEALGIPHRPAPVGGFELELTGWEPGQVARELVARGIDLLSFHPRTPDLESIYLCYTRGDLEAPPRPEEARLPPAPPPRERLAPPHPFYKVLRYDLQLWMVRPALWLLLLAPALLGGVQIMSRRAEHQRYMQQIAAGGLASTTQVTGFEGLGVALQAGLPLLLFIALGLGSLSLSGERRQGTLRNLLLRPVRRHQVALGKGASLLLAVLCSYLLLVLMAFSLSAWAFGFKDVTEALPNGRLYPILTASEIWPQVPRLLISPLLPLTAFAGLGFLAGSLVRRAATGLGMGLMAGALLEIARYPGRALHFERWLPAAYLPWPALDKSYVAYYLDAVTGATNASFRFQETALWTPLLWAGLSFILAALILTRRSVP